MFHTVNITRQIHSDWLIRGITTTVTWHALILTLDQFQIILTEVTFQTTGIDSQSCTAHAKQLIRIIFTFSMLNKGVIVIQHPPTFTSDQKMFVHCDRYFSTHNCMERERERERERELNITSWSLFINTACTLICLHT